MDACDDHGALASGAGFVVFVDVVAPLEVSDPFEVAAGALEDGDDLGFLDGGASGSILPWS